jgi:hypothetical protein
MSFSWVRREQLAPTQTESSVARLVNNGSRRTLDSKLLATHFLSLSSEGESDQIIL